MVSRLLGHFADQQWVRLGHERIEITDTDGLQRLVKARK